ncbi:MAG: phosphopentomutase/phosphoglucosamine mutase [Candidatus Altiarchaeota archaeon]|nr:phosphopentomutase/phosphoglucosamine mutase [Candidatus Altiarchaeota archaeon]
MTGLFGTSGIRRKVEEFPKDFALNIGKAVGTYVKSGEIAVGRDTRKSGPELQNQLIMGILSTGVNVVDLGIVPTPTVGHATKDAKVGVMITASHNPPEYNGFKFFSKDGAFRPNEEKKLESILEKKNFSKGRKGGVRQFDYKRSHIDLILKKVGGVDRPVNVLVDCAGGSGSMMTLKLLELMGCHIHGINMNRDGVFPHGLEPTEANLKETCEAVKDGGYDIAFAHDGDADRACAIDDKGKLIEWDSFLAVLASNLDTVVTTVDASMRIEELCKKVVRVPVGDVAVAEGIRKHKADFGGEPSGSFIFPEIHYFPDGPATVAKAVKMVSDGVFYDMLKNVPSYKMERIKIPCRDQDKSRIMKKLEKIITEPHDRTDGFRVEFREGWALIRPSGTEPFMRITAEGKDNQSLQHAIVKAQGWIRRAMGEDAI